MWPWMLIALLALIGPQSQKPYFDFSKAGAGFYGPGREVADPTDLKSVRIGVLAPTKELEGRHMQSGVAMAVDEANQKGGYRGIPYEMILRADDGPWGIAARQLVDLSYEDKVWTVIGGLDGNRTHIAELVASKAWIPVISPAASDSSVDYANVPWVFRCVPADSRQVEMLLAFAEKRGYKDLVGLTENQREAYTGFLRLQQGAWRNHRPLAAHFQYSVSDPEAVLSRLQGVHADAFVIWGSTASAVTLINAMRSAGVTAPVFGPSTLASPELSSQGQSVGEVVVAAPCDLSRDDPEMQGFVERYRRRTGTYPSAVALYSYDAARLAMSAIEKGGLNRARIRDELACISFQGITGKIGFSPLRGNVAEPVLMTLKDGRWVRISP